MRGLVTSPEISTGGSPQQIDPKKKEAASANKALFTHMEVASNLDFNDVSAILSWFDTFFELLSTGAQGSLEDFEAVVRLFNDHGYTQGAHEDNDTVMFDQTLYPQYIIGQCISMGAERINFAPYNFATQTYDKFKKLRQSLSGRFSQPEKVATYGAIKTSLDDLPKLNILDFEKVLAWFEKLIDARQSLLYGNPSDIDVIRKKVIPWFHSKGFNPVEVEDAPPGSRLPVITENSREAFAKKAIEMCLDIINATDLILPSYWVGTQRRKLSEFSPPQN